jgi:hypothetical protein
MTQYTLDQIVREFLVMKGNDSEHEYPRALQAAIRTLKDLNYDVSGVPKVEVLAVESGGRATLPEDVVRVIRLGFASESGRFVEIFVDNTLIVNTDQTIVSPNIGNPINPTIGDTTSMFRNGQVIGRQYGNAGGGVYTYRMDWERGIAEFSSNVGGQVVLEYLADPNRINGQYLVHPFLEDAIQDGIVWRMGKFKRSVSPNETANNYRVYLNSKHHARVRFASESIGNIINTSRKTINGSLKY